jgi:hypothetical protein
MSCIAIRKMIVTGKDNTNRYIQHVLIIDFGHNLWAERKKHNLLYSGFVEKEDLVKLQIWSTDVDLLNI